MPVSSLNDILEILTRQISNNMAVGSVCTRIMLRTGVNLRAPRPEQTTDAGEIKKVLATLSEMGYVL